MSEPPPATSPRDPDRLAELFSEALEHPPDARRVFLDARCPVSDPLRAELDSLLAAHEAHENDGGFLDLVDGERSAALLRATEESEYADRRVGPFRLLRELGRGGMGVVHLAVREEGGFQQRVAIKLIKRGMDSDAVLQRFLRERQILAGLEHPNVARLLDGGVTPEGQPWFAMEYVEGDPLTDWCEAHRLGVRERLRLFEEACRAVQYAHGQLVIHRDLKPTNMLVTTDGQLKLLDFGIAKLLTDTHDSVTLSQEGFGPLTPEYAAPEQVTGATVTTASDVYVLGLVLYELLTGRRAYGGKGTSREELARAALQAEPAAPSAAAGDPRLARLLKGDLDAVILKALSKETSRRYASAEALADDIRRYLAGQPVVALPDSVGYRAARFVRRHRLGVTAAGVATLSLLAGLLGTAWQAAVAARERDRARLEAQRAEQVKDFLVGMFRASDPAQSKGQEITARDLLERGSERAEKELSGQPAVQSDLLYIMAVSFWALARTDQARPIAERSLELAREAYGPEHPLVARALDAIGSIAYDLGDMAAAEKNHRDSLDMRVRLLAPDDPDVAESMANLGTVLVRQGKFDEAERLLRPALEIRKARLGMEHPDTARSIMKLSEVVSSTGEYAEAARLQEEALAIRRKLLGEPHPEVARSLTGLGNALLLAGDLEGAEAALRDGLSMYRTLLGDDNHTVVLGLHFLAVALHTKGDLAGAEAIYREVLDKDRKLRGEAHINVARALTNLAHVLSDRGKYEEAMPLFEQALALYGRLPGEGESFLGGALDQKAAALIAQARSLEALPCLDRSLAIFKRLYGPEHPRVAAALAKLASAKADLGELDEAERLLREALVVQRRARPGPHASTATTLAALGELLLRADRGAEAEPLLREALLQAKEAFHVIHWRLGDIRSVAGDCFVRIGKTDEGWLLLETGLEHLRKTLGDAHPVTARAKRRLAAARPR